jgi:CMP-N,N'-diacetyllegionaminic acid synthase
MLGDDKVLAVIPARGGSKRTHRKNIRLFRGKPLLLYTVDAASASDYIDKIVVSTEDMDISSVAELSGANVIKRPQELATDTSTNEDVLRHAMTIYPDYNWIVLLQPTSPLRLAKDIDSCLLMALEDGWGCVSYDGENKNGAVYVCHALFLDKGFSFKQDFKFKKRYQMPEERSLDIDYPEQFE